MRISIFSPEIIKVVILRTIVQSCARNELNRYSTVNKLNSLFIPSDLCRVSCTHFSLVLRFDEMGINRIYKFRNFCPLSGILSKIKVV